MKDSFVFYREWLDGLSKLDTTLKAELLDAIIAYGLDGKKNQLSPMAEIVFGFIKPRLDKDAEKYEQICERNRENGKKGGAPKGNQNARKNNPNNPMGYKTTETTQNNPINPNNPKQHDMILYDNDMILNDNTISKEIEKEKKDKDKSLSKKNKFIKPSVDDVYAYILEKGYNVDAEHFVSYYESNGWKVGRNQMKDWRAAVRTWAKNNITLNNNHNNGNNYISRDDRRREEKARRDAEADALVRHLIATSKPAEETAVGEVPYKQLASHSVSGGGKP